MPVEGGYQAASAYYECLHELKLIVDLLYEGGITRMHEFISETAQYGDLTRGPYVIDDHARARMRKRSEEHTSELQSLMRISYAVFCLKKKTKNIKHITRSTWKTIRDHMKVITVK